MGFENLVLVAPQCEVGIEARALAMKGAEILDRAAFFPALEVVSEQVNLLVGTTGRFESGKQGLLSCRTFCEQLIPRLNATKIGIAFGPEDNGLHREELHLCQWWVNIPAGSAYGVLNLAQAVAIVAYELHMGLEEAVPPGKCLQAAYPHEVDALLAHAQRTFHSLCFPRHISIQRLMRRVRKIFGRSQLEQQDVNMLHGLLTAIEKRVSPRA